MADLDDLDLLYATIKTAAKRLDIVVANAGGDTFATPARPKRPGLAGLAANPAESERLLAEEAARVPLGRLGRVNTIGARLVWRS
jgi:hypothetical protein